MLLRCSEYINTCTTHLTLFSRYTPGHDALSTRQNSGMSRFRLTMFRLMIHSRRSRSYGQTTFDQVRVSHFTVLSTRSCSYQVYARRSGGKYRCSFRGGYVPLFLLSTHAWSDPLLLDNMPWMSSIFPLSSSTVFACVYTLLYMEIKLYFVPTRSPETTRFSHIYALPEPPGSPRNSHKNK